MRMGPVHWLPRHQRLGPVHNDASGQAWFSKIMQVVEP